MGYNIHQSLSGTEHTEIRYGTSHFLKSFMAYIRKHNALEIQSVVSHSKLSLRHLFCGNSLYETVRVEMFGTWDSYTRHSYSHYIIVLMAL